MTVDEALRSMVGKTLTAVTGCEASSELMVMTAEDGGELRLYHSQDCCESVRVNDVTGDIADLIGSPLTMCEAVSNSEDERPTEYAKSWTWTFYKFATVKGYVTVRWLGESNGYYSERVDVALDGAEVWG